MRKNLKLFFIFTVLLTGGLFLFRRPDASAASVLSGQVTNLGILVQFADSDIVAPKRADGSPFHINDPDNLTNAEALLNSDAPIAMGTSAGNIPVPSIKKYYEQQSYGKLSITTKILPTTYRDSHNMGYYLPISSDPEGYTTSDEMKNREAELVSNIVAFANNNLPASISASNLDTNGDNQIDLLTFFIESAARETGQGKILWSHVKSGSGSIAGKSVGSYALIYQASSSEYDATNVPVGTTFSLKNSAYGTIAHELGHILGFPDLYRSNYAITSLDPGPVGLFDLMSDSPTSNPYHVSTQLALNQGWHNPLQTINKTTNGLTVTKPQFTDPSERRAIKIQRNPSDREYFIVEYYKPHDPRTNFVADGEGIIIYRVNENRRSQGNYSFTNPGDDYIYIFRPGESSHDSGAGNLHQAPLNLSRKTLGKDLSASTAFDNQTIYYSDGSNSGIVITVTSMANDSVTFNVTFPNIPGDGTAANPYLISSTIDFLYLMNGDTKGKYYKLARDLDFSGVTYPSIEFLGHFDGDNHILSNITSIGSGVFGSVGDSSQNAAISSVKNLQISNLTAKPKQSAIGGDNLGGLTSTAINATFDNIHIRSGIIENIASLATNAATGGFIGSVNQSVTIQNCSVTVIINAVQNVGGFIGYNRDAQLTNISATANVDKLVGAGTEIAPDAGTLNPIPDPTPTDALTLSDLALTKRGDFLFGFTPSSSLTDLAANLTAQNATAIEFKNPSDAPISSGPIATGVKLTFRLDQTAFAYTLVIKGDTNGDGEIQATDYVKVRNHIMGKSQLTGAYLKAADIDGNNDIQATDYIKIRNHIMGKSAINQR